MRTQNTIKFSTQAFNGAPALRIEKMGSEFHGNAIELRERTAQ